jgi:DNA-binding GntR family transcriptional regulator
MSAVPFERPPTAQEAVLAELRRMLITGELAPGTPVRQDALAERLGVSRLPLREALKVLEGEGHVVYAAHRGYVVAELSVDDLVEVYRIRALLEEDAVRSAVPRLTDSDVDALADLVDEVESAGRSGDIAALTAANRRLHFALFDASGLPRMVRLIRVLWDSTDVYRSVYFGDDTNRGRVDSEHRDITAALRRRDADEAVRLLAEHRRHAVESVSRVIGG